MVIAVVFVQERTSHSADDVDSQHLANELGYLTPADRLFWWGLTGRIDRPRASFLQLQTPNHSSIASSNLHSLTLTGICYTCSAVKDVPESVSVYLLHLHSTSSFHLCFSTGVIWVIVVWNFAAAASSFSGVAHDDSGAGVPPLHRNPVFDRDASY
jgi:hypothetical protein